MKPGPNPAVEKRKKELLRKKRQEEKAERRQRRQSERASGDLSDAGEDPDLAGIVPGPQPTMAGQDPDRSDPTE